MNEKWKYRRQGFLLLAALLVGSLLWASGEDPCKAYMRDIECPPEMVPEHGQIVVTTECKERYTVCPPTYLSTDGLLMEFSGHPYEFSVFKCPRCDGWWMSRGGDGWNFGCATIHGPNDCCHISDTRLDFEWSGNG